MKSLLALGVLLLSAPPAFADDLLYLRCKATTNIVISYAKTSKTIEDRTIDDIAIIKIDFVKKTVHDSRSEGPASMMVQNNNMTVTVEIDDDELKINDESDWDLTLPISFSQRGSGIDKIKNQAFTYNAKGVCEEVDSLVWDKALNQ